MVRLGNQSKRRNWHKSTAELLKAKRFAMICTFSDATQRELRTILKCDRFAAKEVTYRIDLRHLRTSCSGPLVALALTRWSLRAEVQRNAAGCLLNACRMPSARWSAQRSCNGLCRSIWISHMGRFYDSASPQNWDSSLWSEHIGSCGCEESSLFLLW